MKCSAQPPYNELCRKDINDDAEQCSRCLRVFCYNCIQQHHCSGEDLDFSTLQDTNLQRATRWHQNGIEDWSPLEWAGAMAGEAGEACNAAKKLKRIDGSLQNLNTEEGRIAINTVVKAKDAIAHEVADTIIYGILLLSRINRNAAEAVRECFNRKSDEYNFPEKV